MVAVIAGVALSPTSFITSDKSTAAQVGERLAQKFCIQVISCGTKDGKVKEYPTPCDARDDGATDIHPKSGPSC
jgi:hypothetical protein